MKKQLKNLQAVIRVLLKIKLQIRKKGGVVS